MAEPALQIAVMAVLSVRSDGEYRNATAAETTSLTENTYVAHHLRPVAVRFDLEGVSCHASGMKRFHGWTFLQTPQRDIRIYQVRDVDRTIQTLQWSAGKLHEIHPSLSAEQVVSRVTSIHNELDRIKGNSPFQWTQSTCLEHRGP